MDDSASCTIQDKTSFTGSSHSCNSQGDFVAKDLTDLPSIIRGRVKSSFHYAPSERIHSASKLRKYEVLKTGAVDRTVNLHQKRASGQLGTAL